MPGRSITNISGKNAEKEQDLFSFKVALRNLLKEPSSNNSDKKGVETKDYSLQFGFYVHTKTAI